jgi:hypothetical protein
MPAGECTPVFGYGIKFLQPAVQLLWSGLLLVCAPAVRRAANSGNSSLLQCRASESLHTLQGALEYVNSFNLIHVDLKPENILIKDEKRSALRLLHFTTATTVAARCA